ncbi:MAG: phage virion morphogenesis protein [Roseibium sp.]
MAGISAAITIEDTEVNAALARVEEAGGNTLALMQDISAAMLFSVQRRFESETAPDGQAWPRHAPRTARARLNRKRRGNQPITPRLLRQSNRLFKSIVAEASDAQAATGTNLVYAAIHQQGGTITQYPQSRQVRFRKVGNQTRFARKAHKRAFEKPVTFGQRTIVIPARPYLGFSDEDRAELLRLADVHFEQAASGGSGS